MGEVRFGEPRWVERFWRLIDVDGAAPFEFPEPDEVAESEARCDLVLDALRNAGLTYAVDPPVHVENGQRVRPPGEILAAKKVTCLDMVGLTAAGCLRAGLRPWVIVTERDGWRHAWLVVQTDRPHQTREQPSGLLPDHAFDRWEHSQKGAIETREELERLLFRRGHRVLDPTRLAAGFSESTDPIVAWDPDVVGSRIGGLGEPQDEVLMSVCDVAFWWRRPALDPENTSRRAVTGTVRSVPSMDRPRSLRVARPVLDARCDDWLRSGTSGLLLVGSGGRGATTAVQRLVEEAESTGARVALVAAAEWNVAPWNAAGVSACWASSADEMARHLFRQIVELRWEQAEPPSEDLSQLAEITERGGPWETGLRRFAEDLSPGGDVVVVVDGVDADLDDAARTEVRRLIELVSRFGREFGRAFARRFRIVLASEPDLHLVDGLQVDTIDLDEVDREPAEIEARAELVRKLGMDPEEVVDFDTLTWAETVMVGARDGAPDATFDDRMRARLRAIRRGRKRRADSLLGVLLALSHPAPRSLVAQLAALEGAADDTIDRARPWLVEHRDGLDEVIELQPGARRWLLRSDEASGLTEEGHALVTRALLDAANETSPSERVAWLRRYADDHLVRHALASGDAPRAVPIDEVTALVGNRAWQEGLLLRGRSEGVDEVSSFRRWTVAADRLAGRLGVRARWQDPRSLAARPKGARGLAALVMGRQPDRFRDGGAELVEETGDDLGVQLRRAERDGGVTVEIECPAAWGGAYLLVSITTDHAIDLLVELDDDARAALRLVDQSLASHDIEVGLPLTADLVDYVEGRRVERSPDGPVEVELTAPG